MRQRVELPYGIEGWVRERAWVEWVRTAVLAVLLVLAAVGLATLIEGNW